MPFNSPINPHAKSANTIVSLCKALNISTDFLFSEFIDSDSCEYTDLIDSKFLENYSQLNDYNRKVVNRLTNDLIKLQLEENFKKQAKLK